MENTKNIQTEILQKLTKHGISENEIAFYQNHFRYNGWRCLPDEALKDISDLVFEDLYEDNDGDDERGRPIIRRMWYYEYVNSQS